MTTMLATSYCATDAKKSAVEAAVALLTPSYTIALTRKVCAIAEGVTYDTPATHWHGNAQSVDADLVRIWQDAANAILPAELDLSAASMSAQDIMDAMDGIKIWTATNCSDAVAWADTNLASEGLQYVPDPPL